VLTLGAKPDIDNSARYPRSTVKIASSDAYNTAFGDRRVIAVEVDSHTVYQGAYREPITDAGTAHLDRLTWVTRHQLTELHPDRHAHVTSVIRELIGNT